MATALKKVEEQPVAIAPKSDGAAIMEMLQRITTDPTVSIERIEQAFAFYERVQASQSRKAFDAAIAAAKSEIPVIAKNRLVDYELKAGGRTTYRHEDLGEIARTVDPILSKHGLSYRFRVTSNLNEPVKVTCVVSHVDGYFEETTLSAGRDESGGKNAIQGVGSTVTYLQRYTLKAALGLAAAKDDDAKTAEKTTDDLATVTDAQAQELLDLINSGGGNKEAFLKIANADTLHDVLAKDFSGLKRVLETKRNNRVFKEITTE